MHLRGIMHKENLKKLHAWCRVQCNSLRLCSARPKPMAYWRWSRHGVEKIGIYHYIPFRTHLPVLTISLPSTNNARDVIPTTLVLEPTKAVTARSLSWFLFRDLPRSPNQQILPNGRLADTPRDDFGSPSADLFRTLLSRLWAAGIIQRCHRTSPILSFILLRISHQRNNTHHTLTKHV